MDIYLDDTKVLERLIQEYNKHKKLIIAVDWDDTIFDFHNRGTNHKLVIDLLKECSQLDFYIVLFTAALPERYDSMKLYCEELGIKINGVNKNPITLPYGNHGKIYYNINLCDRSGLSSSYAVLRQLIDRIKSNDLESLFKTKNTNTGIIRSFDVAFAEMKRRNWDRIFILCDIHHTILYPDYTNSEPLKFYPYAKEVLQYLSQRKDIELILYTCSYPEEIVKYLKFFNENGINFKQTNKNNAVLNTGYGYYIDKPYTNIILDDKSGFFGDTDWLRLMDYFKIISFN